MHRFLFITILLLLLIPVSGRAQTNRSNPEDSITIPGGFATVARLTGIGDSSPDSESGLRRVFTYLVRLEPPSGAVSRTHPERDNLISYLKQYSLFLQYLQKEHIIPSDPSPKNLQEIRFPLQGDRTRLESTRKLLDFFGIDCRIRNDSTGPAIEIKAARRILKRENLYKAMGFHLQDPGLREIRISLEPGRVPLLLGQSKWEEILSSGNPDLLFQSFVENPKAMRLYLALAACSQSTRAGLLDTIEPAQLLKFSDMLLLFGADLNFKNGTLEFPGYRQTWGSLPGSPDFSLNALLSEGGAGLVLYSALSASPSPVQKYFTASPGRLKSYLEILKKYSSGESHVLALAAGQELARILRISAVNPEGLILDLNSTISDRLSSWIGIDPTGLSPSGQILLNPKVLAKLMPGAGTSPYLETSRADILEFLHYLENAQPDSLNAESVDLLMKDPGSSAVFLDLIGDLEPPPALLSKYLQYCTKVAAAGERGWNQNRTRTSQSLLFLIAAMRRESTISKQEADVLLQHALDAFSADDQAQFAFNTAGFISTELINRFSPESRNFPDPLLSVLSGFRPPRLISFGGENFAIDLSGRKYERMQKTICSQSITPIPTLLQVFSILRTIEAAANKPAINESIKLLSKLVDEIKAPEKTPGESMGNRKVPGARTDLGQIKMKIAAPENWIAGLDSATQAKEIAAQLNTELGVSLLAYCYAYSAIPDLTVLTFDPNFVRKHRFYNRANTGISKWNRSHFVQDDEEGGLIEGSLAGMEYELTRLHLAESEDDLGISSNIDIAPSILSGMRRVRPELRSDRSQAYVALATRLGQSLISLPAANEPFDNWVRDTLAPLLSPQRLEEISARRKQPDPSSAAAILSRSELFLLGQAFFNSQEKSTGKCPEAELCSLVVKLSALVPKQGSLDYNAFQNEVSQYGISLRSRIGLPRFSFDMIESYERLGKNPRLHYLYDRICDLKIRIAELNYSLGLPAFLGEIEAEPALREVLPSGSQADAGEWKSTIENISGLNEKAVPGWISSILSDGSLAAAPKEKGSPGL